MQAWYQLQVLTNTCEYTEPYNIEGYIATLHMHKLTVDHVIISLQFSHTKHEYSTRLTGQALKSFSYGNTKKC